MGTGTIGTYGNIDKIKERVQKLLNQAADQAGTAEGDAFYRKAFDLMATYGFEERDLDSPGADDEVVTREFRFAGAYTDMQSQLLSYLVAALHCVAFRHGKRNSTKVESTMVFGVRRHVERVELLFAILNPQMAAGARRVKGDRLRGVSTVVARRSYMHGFAVTIYERLSTAETNVATGQERYALALIDDVGKAASAREDFIRAQGLYLVSSKTKRQTDTASYWQGMSDGENSDLGQTRVRARPALPC